MIMSSKRKSQSSLFETRDLIRLVKDRRCLWDRYEHDYRDRATKEAAWLEIYKVIEPDYDHFSEDMKTLIGSQITKKWYNVRDSFVKSKKHCSRNKPYVYSKLLSFLEPVYCEEKDKSEESSDQWLNEVFAVDESETNGSKRQKVDYEEKNEHDDNVIAILTNLLTKEDDDDRAFFRSITPAVKKLSEDSRMEFRIQVMNLLQVLKTKERNDMKLLKQEVGADEDDDDDDDSE